MLFQTALDTKTLIEYKAVVLLFCIVLQGMCVKVLLSLEVFITCHIGGFSPPYELFLFGA